MTQRDDAGFTLIELLIVVAIISVIAAIAVPGLMHARMTGNEVSALSSLRATSTAQVMYSASCGNGSYAADYTVLGTAPAGSEPFISADLGLSATPQKAGYNFAMGAGAGSAAGPNDCNGTATISTWYATATPMSVGTTGTRAFAVNAQNTVWQDTTGVPPTEPFTASATVSPIQ